MRPLPDGRNEPALVAKRSPEPGGKRRWPGDSSLCLMRLHVQTYGRGFPLIILHGLLGSQDNLATVSRGLSEERLVVGVDQRNHGRSPHSAEMTYPVMAEDIGELMDEAGFASADILGHSMGGKTAMEFALRCPGRVRHLVVVDIAPRAYAPSHLRILEAMLALDPARFAHRAEAEEALLAEIPDRRVCQFLLKNLTRDANGRLQWRLGLKEISENYSNVNSALAESRVFGGAVRFIRGERSDYIRDEDFELCRGFFPAATFSTVRGASHWVHADAPAEFLHIVRQFLAE